MSENGKKGGASTKERYGRDHFRNIAKSKKGLKYKKKVATDLQKDVIDDIVPPLTNK